MYWALKQRLVMLQTEATLSAIPSAHHHSSECHTFKVNNPRPVTLTSAVLECSETSETSEGWFNITAPPLHLLQFASRRVDYTVNMGLRDITHHLYPTETRCFSLPHAYWSFCQILEVCIWTSSSILPSWKMSGKGYTSCACEGSILAVTPINNK